jgi:hypothetical protein
MAVCCSFINAIPGSVYEVEELSSTITTSATSILPNDSRRCAIVIHNHSGGVVDFGFTRSVFGNNGFFSIDSGQGQLWSWDHHGPIVQRQWYAVRTSGSGNLIVTTTRCIRYGTP